MPVYNGEKYISSCLESIIYQSFSNFQLIIVNDGSTDNTKSICKKYENQDSRICYIENPINLGVSASRNKALDIANGEYIFFVDVDDKIRQNTLLTINDTLNNNCLLYIYNYELVQNNIYTTISTKYIDPNISNIICDIIEPISCKTPFTRTICAKVFHNSIIKNIRFNEKLKLGEDACFLVEVIKHLKIDQIQFNKDIWYTYNKNNVDSASTKPKEYVYEQSFLQINVLKELTNNLNYIDTVDLNTSLCKLSWRLFWVIYYQGQILNNDKCFDWLISNRTLLLNKNIKKIDFNDKIKNLALKFRNIICSNSFIKFYRNIYNKRSNTYR